MRDKKEGGGVALSSLRPRYHALCLQWMYRNGEAYNSQTLSPQCHGSCTSGSQSQSSFPPIPSQPWRR